MNVRIYGRGNRHCRMLLAGLAFIGSVTLKLGQAQTYQVIIYEPPSGFVETRAEGIGGQQRVGAARIEGGVDPENTHAFLWSGLSPVPVDLHPSNWHYSKANATDGNHQVG